MDHFAKFYRAITSITDTLSYDFKTFDFRTIYIYTVSTKIKMMDCMNMRGM
jgi:hypothetical protein